MNKISVEEVELIIKIPKQTAREMRWQPKKGGYSPKCWEFKTALEINGVAQESLFFYANYIRSHSIPTESGYIHRKQKITCAIFYKNARILAYDYDLHQAHQNKIEKGLPYFGKMFTEPHKHIWTNSGYGYAEPLVLTDANLEAIIKAFVDEANITITGGFIPVKEEQLELF